MRQYLLDSNIVAAYFLGKAGAEKLAHAWIQNNEAATSLLVYGEVCEYLKGLPDAPKRLIELRAFMKKVYPYSLTYSLLELYADIHRAMRPPQGPGLIGDIDTLIAATALANNLTIVTTDSDFTRVPHLSMMHIPRETLRK